MRHILLLFMLGLVPGLSVAQTARPADTATVAPPVRSDSTAKPAADPAAYLRRQTLQAPGNLAQPAPTGTVQIQAAPSNQPVLTPTGYQNSQSVGSTVQFKGKPKKKRKAD